MSSALGSFEKVLRLGEGRRLKRAAEQAAYVATLEPQFEAMSDEELRPKEGYVNPSDAPNTVMLRSASRDGAQTGNDKQVPRETKIVTPDEQKGIGADIAAGVAGGIASGAAGAIVQQGFAKLGSGGKDKPKK